jgi:hypothetical protein
MKSHNNKEVEKALYLVDGIHSELLRIEARAGHSAEMASVRRALLKIPKLRNKLLRMQSRRGKWHLDWKIAFPFLVEVAEYLIKHK